MTKTKSNQSLFRCLSQALFQSFWFVWRASATLRIGNGLRAKALSPVKHFKKWPARAMSHLDDRLENALTWV